MLSSRPSKRRRVIRIEHCSVVQQDIQCCLEPFVKELVKPTDSVPDLHGLITLLRKVHSLLNNSSSRYSDESLKCLHGVAIVRIGLLSGNRRGFLLDQNQSETLKAISLISAVLCQTFRRQQCAHSEILVVYHDILQILEGLNKLEFESSSRALVITTLENCMDLVNIWSFGKFNTKALMYEHKFLGEALVLAFLRSTTVFEDQRILKSVRTFFLAQSRATRCAMRWRSLFDIAFRVLDMQDDADHEIPDHEIPEYEKDFYQSCVLARSPSKVLLPAHFEVVLHHILSFDQSGNKWLTKTALQVLEEHSKCLPSNQVSQCLDVTSGLILTLDADSPILLPAIKCLGALLEKNVGRTFTTNKTTSNGVIERLRKMVFSEKWHDSVFPAAHALVGLLELIIRSQEPSTPDQKRYFSLLCQLLMLRIDGVTGRSIDFLRRLLGEKGQRKRILIIHPELVACLAEIGSGAHISEVQKKQIATFVCSFVSDQRWANNLIRGPWVLRFFASVLTEDSTTLPSFLAAQLMVLQILCILSGNPCNRRFLAKEGGLLTSMIRFARRDREIFGNGGLRFEDLKATILCLGRVL